ncbi:hypothetical protein, partial [Klebsiella pneumoniae]|uniref:hypothetical protein n=1 Tax=Klebsiella pneumoniae TaxID=573 RepID=UPI00235E7F36
LRLGLVLPYFGVVFVSFGIPCNPQHTQRYRRRGGGEAGLYRAKELGRSRIVSFGRLKTS